MPLPFSGPPGLSLPAARLVYPVISRRAGGLSLGIDLFPQGKDCSFDCPYCEVFPFSSSLPFSSGELEDELEAFLDAYAKGAGEGPLAHYPIRDLCLSGSGEPSLSPFLPSALEAIARFRTRHPDILASTRLVLITNSTGFLRPEVASLLAEGVAAHGLDIWAKLDSGSQAWFEKMSGTKLSLEALVAGIETFAAKSPIRLQTMFCRLDGVAPDEAEVDAYSGLLRRLGEGGALVREVQLYTQARPAPAGRTEALSDAGLLDIARRVMASCPFPLRAFGSRGELEAGHS